MSRRHTFVIVVLLGAAAVAGLLAMTRTAALGSPASASSGPDDAISFRLRKLDRLEASLRKQLEGRRGAVATSPAPLPGFSVPSTGSRAQSYDDADEHEGAEEHEDVAGFDDEDRDD